MEDTPEVQVKEEQTNEKGKSVAKKKQKIKVVKEAKGKKRCQKQRVFREIWLEVEGFKKWLRPSKVSKEYCICIYCRTKLSARFGVLKEHAMCRSHCRWSKLEKPFPPNYFDIPRSKDNERREKIVEAELKFVGMCVDLNLPFVSMPKLLKSIQNIDSQKTSVFQQMHIGSTKARNLVVNILGNEQDYSFRDILCNTNFGVWIYKGKNKSNKDILIIVIRFCNLETGEIETKIWDQAPASVNYHERASVTLVDKLFNSFVTSFDLSDVPLRNISSICYDGCKSMNDDLNDLKGKLASVIPHTVLVECPLYIMNFCLQHAMDQLPNDVYCFIINVNGMLNSADEFGSIKIDIDSQTTGLFKIDATQSLNFEACVNRILEQWTIIQGLSMEQALHSDIIANEVIGMLGKMDTKCYILLLQRTLSEINAFNKAIETQEFMLTKMKEMIDTLYKSIASWVLKSDYVQQTPSSELEVLDNPNYLEYEDFHIGDEIRFYLKTNGTDLENFCKNTYNFVVALTAEMKGRFHDFKNPLYDAVECLLPENAISPIYRENNPDIFTLLLDIYCKLNKTMEHRQKLASEWAELGSIQITENMTFPKLENFWHFIYRFEDEDGTCKYANLAEFALLILCTPHATVKVEPPPNTQKYLKSKTKKNRLYDATIDGTVRAQQVVKAKGKELFQPTQQMIKKALACQYYDYKTAS